MWMPDTCSERRVCESSWATRSGSGRFPASTLPPVNTTTDGHRVSYRVAEVTESRNSCPHQRLRRAYNCVRFPTSYTGNRRPPSNGGQVRRTSSWGLNLQNRPESTDSESQESEQRKQEGGRQRGRGGRVWKDGGQGGRRTGGNFRADSHSGTALVLGDAGRGRGSPARRQVREVTSRGIRWRNAEYQRHLFERASLCSWRAFDTL